LEATFRHGKRIGLQIGNLGAMHHLGMSGRWERTSPGEPVPRHARLGLVREDEVVIWFVDTRRFGWLVPCAPDALETKLSEGHGPDVWDQPLDGEGLAARFPTRRAIKTALLDQKCVAGMGNIHAVESLWYARIDPRTPAHTLTEAQWSRLAVEMHRQMARTLEMLDVEKVAYVTDKDGPNPFQVYGREADPCPRCGEGVQRGWLAKRSTFWCPICQPRDEARAKG
jgi:formamidopyrimidine-DNA glycosylase